MLGVISDLIRTNRILIEDTLEHTKKARFGKSGTHLLQDQGHSPTSLAVVGLQQRLEPPLTAKELPVTTRPR